MKRKPADDTPDCAPTFTAIRISLWEGWCPCGWWFRGTKIECEQAANGHKPNQPVQP